MSEIVVPRITIRKQGLSRRVCQEILGDNRGKESKIMG